MKKTTIGHHALILASLTIPFWIVFDAVAALVVPGFANDEPIVASLATFRASVVVGNCVIAWLIYQRKAFAAALTSLVVLGFFLFFVLDYSIMAGNAFCSAGMGCGPSPTFLKLFLEDYDEAFIGLFPYHFLWIIGFAVVNGRRQSTLR